ncbi:hypothetical protein C2G38_2067363 [Gigaspora rosea]|uniref:Uncharacterized protein n=1 Tax=Gigaspora rosea TaxID=44941 RepID=A0A397VUP2_9GLOM|nr:hypothetical protein C2G38_2067363 [Gigaspora rosea]
MNKKFVYFALTLILFCVSIKESKSGIIPQSNVFTFLKRDTAAKMLVANAVFNNADSVMGAMTFEEQDYSGITYVYGSFSKGYEDCYKVVLKDNGVTVIDLTKDLNITVTTGGATNPFWATIDFNLRKFLSYDKRKRQSGGQTADILNGRQTVSSAPITALPS